MSGCEEVRDILLSAARGETVSAAGQRFLREHAEDCTFCRRRLANERMLSAGLTALASATQAVPPAAVRSAVMAEFRKQQKPVEIRRPWVQWGAIAAVAAALVLAAFLLIRDKRVEPKSPVVKAPEVAQQTPLPRDAVSAVPIETAQIAPRKVRRKAVWRAPVQARQPAEEPAEVATDFIEIPYVEPLRPDERADVYRIQMPRANMAAFGLPVAGGRLDSRITADVLAGEDGVVRAVRFIR
jgi:hypothetical protein